MLLKDGALGGCRFKGCKGIGEGRKINVCVFEYEWLFKCGFVLVFCPTILCWVLLTVAGGALSRTSIR